MFGPTGVREDRRGNGIGTAMLLTTLHAMCAETYAYAIIGWAGPVEWYTRTVGATVAPEMLQQTAQKLPDVQLLPLDLTSEDWASLADQRFDRIVAAYVFHEFPLADAIAMLRRLAADHLLPGGRIVFGDIAFPTVALREEAARFWAQWWDRDEHRGAADEALPALEAAGFIAAYEQVSACAGVFRLTLHASAALPA